MSTVARTAIVSSLLLAWATLPGCESSTAPPASAPDPQPQPAEVADPDPDRAPRFDRETWDVVLMGGEKVGSTQTQIATVREGDQTLVQTTAVSELSLKRFNQTVDQKITITSVEHPDGQLVRFSSTMGTAPSETTAEGRYQAGKLHVTTRTPGKSEKMALTWDPRWRGCFGAEQSLREKPLQPGEKRTIKMLMAIFNVVGEIEFSAIDYESTQLLGQSRELLRIESRTKIGQTSIDSTMWTDRQGETLKTSIPSLQQETVRTTREIATARPQGGQKFDLGTASVVKVQRPLTRPHFSQKIVYQATIPDGDPAKAFPTGATQAVKRLDAHTIELTVQALRPETALTSALGTSPPPTPADLQPNNLIQSDDPRVIEIAGSVARNEQNPWLVAQALEKRVQELVQVTEFSQAIASAAEVAQTKQGDCTEHAVLLAAACRARQIPARVAIGLVYYGQAGGFAYHMWTEVWIDRHWIPLDATLGQGGIGAAHLKVADSHLAGGSGFEAILPVFEVMGRLKLKIVAVDDQP